MPGTVDEKPSPESRPRVPIPGPQATLREMLTDPRAILDGVVPPVLFVGVNSIKGLVPAAVAAGVWGIGTAVYRLARRQKVSYALGGLVGIGIALLIALRTGRASTYFLPNTVIGALYGAAGIVSILIGRPASSAISRLIEGKPKEWYRMPRVRQTHLTVTLVWSLFFLGRSGLRYVLILQNREWGLAATTVALGFPAVAVLVVGSYGFVRWRLGPGSASGPQQTES